MPSPASELTANVTGLALSDLELMHHWTAHTHKGFTETIGGQHDTLVWQLEVPALALQFPLVMRSLLAGSALHLSNISPSKERSNQFAVLAARHQALGLAAYRHSTQIIPELSTDPKSHAFLVSGHLILGYVNANPYGSALDWISLVRGTRGTIRQETTGLVGLGKITVYYDLIWNEGVDYLLNPRDWSFVALMDKLDVLIESGEWDVAEIDIYRENVKMLRRSFAMPYQTWLSPPPGWHISLGLWVEAISQPYWNLLVARKPLAWVLLSYYCVGMSLKLTMVNSWFWDGVGVRTMREIEGVLSGTDPKDEWMKWLEDSKEIAELQGVSQGQLMRIEAGRSLNDFCIDMGY